MSRAAQARVLRAGRVVKLYLEFGNVATPDDGDIEEAVTDILADLRHYCQSAGVDFERVAGNGAAHFEAEAPEPGAPVEWRNLEPFDYAMERMEREIDETLSARIHAITPEPTL